MDISNIIPLTHGFLGGYSLLSKTLLILVAITLLYTCIGQDVWKPEI